MNKIEEVLGALQRVYAERHMRADYILLTQDEWDDLKMTPDVWTYLDIYGHQEPRFSNVPIVKEGTPDHVHRYMAGQRAAKLSAREKVYPLPKIVELEIRRYGVQMELYAEFSNDYRIITEVLPPSGPTQIASALIALGNCIHGAKALQPQLEEED